MVTDEEIRAGMALLAETEGISAEPAGGTTVAVARKLVEQGRIGRQDPVVIAITGNGYKTAEALAGTAGPTVTLGRSFSEFKEWHDRRAT
jgi:threonine synthase